MKIMDVIMDVYLQCLGQIRITLQLNCKANFYWPLSEPPTDGNQTTS